MSYTRRRSSKGGGNGTSNSTAKPTHRLRPTAPVFVPAQVRMDQVMRESHAHQTPILRPYRGNWKESRRH